MAEERKTAAQPAAQPTAASDAGGGQSQTIGVRLLPVGESDLPIFSNFARVQMSPSAVLVDFGFLEPNAVAALARTARSGGKMPEAIDGRLAARFALTPDALVALHQQLGQAIASLQTAAKQRQDGRPD